HDFVSFVLVESGQVRGPSGPAAGLPLHRRQPRPGNQRAARRPERPLPAVPLPFDHELRGRLPQGVEPQPRDQQDQGADAQAGGIVDPRRPRTRMAELDRIRWRCRRGLLELDLVLNAFVCEELARLPAHELTAFARLLDASDNDLWDWV